MLDFILSLWQFKLLVGCYFYALIGFAWVIIFNRKLMDERVGELYKEYPDLGIAVGMHIVLITHLLAIFVVKGIRLLV